MRPILIASLLSCASLAPAKEGPWTCPAYQGGSAAWCEPSGGEWKPDDQNADFNAARMAWKRADGHGSYSIVALDGSGAGGKGQKRLDKLLAGTKGKTLSKGWRCGVKGTTELCAQWKEDVIILITLTATPDVWKELGGMAALEGNAVKTFGFQPATE